MLCTCSSNGYSEAKKDLTKKVITLSPLTSFFQVEFGVRSERRPWSFSSHVLTPDRWLWLGLVWCLHTDSCNVPHIYNHLLSQDQFSILRLSDGSWTISMTTSEHRSTEEDHEMQLKMLGKLDIFFPRLTVNVHAEGRMVQVEYL